MADLAQVLATGGTALVSAAAGAGPTLPNQDASRPCRVVTHRHKCNYRRATAPNSRKLWRNRHGSRANPRCRLPEVANTAVRLLRTVRESRGSAVKLLLRLGSI